MRKTAGDAGRDAGDHEDAALAARDAEERPTVEPSAPPICIVGPSRPPEPPVPSVNSDASALTHATRRRMTPPLVVEGVDHRVAAAAARLGREREMSPPPSAPTAGRNRSSHQRKGRPASSARTNVSPLARRTR